MKYFEWTYTQPTEVKAGQWLSENSGIEPALLGRLFFLGSIWNNNRRLKSPEDEIQPGVLKIYSPEKPIEEYTLAPEHILFEDEHIMAVNKVAGINTCPTPFSDIDCLEWGLQKLMNERGCSHTFHTVHRLDRPAQGILLFGKSKEAESRLGILFMKRMIKKSYLAVTEPVGKVPAGLLISEPLTWKEKTRPARSFFKYLGGSGTRSVFLASPLTGRPHQLRKHAAMRLAPVIGDAQYGGYTEFDLMHLCSVYYRFRHPFTGQLLQITRVPEYYRNILIECGISCDAREGVEISG